MNDQIHPGGSSNERDNYSRLASWLQQIMQQPATDTKITSVNESDTLLEILLDSSYHLRFYQQLPDFIMALLHDEAQAIVQYAPLLYHLAGCSECHAGYLDLYDALRAAIYPQGPRPQLGQGTRTLAATPQRMLGHLCRVLISQSEALFRQGRHDHVDNTLAARSLLRLALSISARIGQHMIREQSLHDLVRVANLFELSDNTQEDDAHVYAYTPVMAGSSGMRGGKKALRRIDTPLRSPSAPQEEPAILIQSQTLEGSITQQEGVLMLRLQDLNEELRGSFVTITVPLGALLEPVRWRGGNPRAIHSTVAVDAQGTLITPLGETELRLSNNEEHNLLEAMFMLLEIRAAD